MVHVFEFTKRGEKDFIKLSRALQKRLIAKLEYFQNQPNPFEFAQKLAGMKDRYRFRIGTYRMIVSKKNRNKIVILLIVRIAHRKEVYL